jgi:NTE family protein
MGNNGNRSGVSRQELEDGGLGWVLDSTFLGHLAQDEQDETLRAMVWRAYGRDEVLIEAGAPARGVDLLIDGQVVVQALGPHGAPHTLARLGPGHMVGERSLLYDERTAARVRAVSPVRSLHIAPAAFAELLARLPKLRRYVEDLVRLRAHFSGIQDALLRNPFLRSLGRADLERLVLSGVVERYDTGTRIVSAGERDRDVFVVLRGRIGVSAPVPGDGDGAPARRQLVTTKGPGSLIGHAAALLETPRTADLDALEATELLRVRPQSFLGILARNPPLQRRLYQHLATLDVKVDAVLAPQHRALRVCVYGTRPSLGTTTVAYGVAAALRDGPRPVLIDLGGDATARRLGLNVDDVTLGGVAARVMQVPEAWGLEVHWPRDPSDLDALVEASQRTRDAPSHLVVCGAGQAQRDVEVMQAADAVVFVRRASEPEHDHALRRGQFRVEVVRLEAGHELPLRSAENLVRLANDPSSSEAFWRRGDIAVLVNRQRPLGRAHRRIVRALTGRTVGVAFGGGGALGFAHIGLVKALEAAEIPIDYVAGSSFGALVAGLYAAGGVPHLEVLVAERQKLLRAVGAAVIDTGAFARFVDEVTGTVVMEMTEIPFFPVAVDVLTGEEVVVSSGTVGDGVRTSSCLPGIYPALPHGTTYLVDGGIGNNVPASVMWEANANFIVASNIIPSLPAGRRTRRAGRLWEIVEPTTFGRFDHLVRSMYLLMSQAGRDRASLADYVFDLDVEGFNIYDFPRGDRIAEAGQRQAEEQMPMIREAYETDRGIRFGSLGEGGGGG